MQEPITAPETSPPKTSPTGLPCRIGQGSAACFVLPEAATIPDGWGSNGLSGRSVAVAALPVRGCVRVCGFTSGI